MDNPVWNKVWQGHNRNEGSDILNSQEIMCISEIGSKNIIGQTKKEVTLSFFFIELDLF